jgi:hypothetical protein
VPLWNSLHHAGDFLFMALLITLLSSGRGLYIQTKIVKNTTSFYI